MQDIIRQIEKEVAVMAPVRDEIDVHLRTVAEREQFARLDRGWQFVQRSVRRLKREERDRELGESLFALMEVVRSGFESMRAA